MEGTGAERREVDFVAAQFCIRHRPHPLYSDSDLPTACAYETDSDRLQASWWQDNAAGDANATATAFRVLQGAMPGQTIHLILEATDDGTPTRYQRVIVTVRP